MKLITILLLIVATTTLAQDNYNDYVQQESKRYKIGATSMLVSGILMIGGGAAMLANDRSTGGAIAMGATLAAAGVGLDVASIFLYKKRKTLLEESNKSDQTFHLFISPNGARISYNF